MWESYCRENRGVSVHRRIVGYTEYKHTHQELIQCVILELLVIWVSFDMLIEQEYILFNFTQPQKLAFVYMCSMYF